MDSSAGDDLVGTLRAPLIDATAGRRTIAGMPSVPWHRTGLTVTLAFAMVSLVHASPAAATLVVGVPTRDGFVVAADSRLTAGGQYIDGVKKLHAVDDVNPAVVFAITGVLAVAEATPLDAALREGRPSQILRWPPVVASAIRALPDPVLNAQTLDLIVDALASALHSVKERLIGNETQLVLFQAHAGALTVVTSVVSIHAPGVSVGERKMATYKQDDAHRLVLAGADGYTKTHVLAPGSAGRHLLSPRFEAVVSGKRLVRDFDVRDGMLIATSIIRAAEKTTELVRVPGGGGIGGPVQAYLITETSVKPVAVK